jgi:Ca2+-binding RTX toxin-like protein
MAGGECMCATCWDHAFCYNRDTAENAEVNADGTCPANAPVLAEQTSRIDATLNARESTPLFCVPDQEAVDEGKLLQPVANATQCPANRTDREELGRMDLCLDIPADCRDASCPVHGSPGLCTFASPDRIGDFRTACASDVPASAHKLRENSCAIYGFDIPHAAPARYCYLNCWGDLNDVTGTTQPDCDPALFDPPGTSSETLFLDLDPAVSRAQITVISAAGVDQGELHMQGTVGLQFSRNCLPPITLGDVACDDAAITFMSIASTDFATILGRKVEHVVLFNPQPVALTGQTTAFGSFLMFNLDGGTQLYVSADVEGMGRLGVAYSTVSAVGGDITWSTRTANVDGNLQASTNDFQTILVLILGGTLGNVNEPPVAKCKDVPLSAGATCQATVGKSDVDDGSFDPDGNSINCVLDSTGPFGLGAHDVKLTCTDSRGGSNSCHATVTVSDDTPPQIVCPVSVNALCTSASGAAATFTTTASDNCGTTSPVTCTRTSGSSFALGTTTDSCSTTDGAGHPVSCSFNVTVALGDNPVCCPAGTRVILGTPNNDVLNGSVGSDCILGRGGQDTINGNGGNDFISGGDGDDIISGGAGNDLIFGGTGQDRVNGDAGNDVMSGGDGDDQLFGGDGDDTLLGGQGQDRLFGDNGNDICIGETGNDRLEGGAGADTLIGGGPHDTCIGGPDVDTFLTCQSQTQ